MPATDNPLKLDPSGTSLLRRQFTSEMRKRFDEFRSVVWAAVCEDPLSGSDTQRAKHFTQWATDQANQLILGFHPLTGRPARGDSWLFAFLNAAYMAGVARSYYEIEGHRLGVKPEYAQGAQQTFQSDVSQSHHKYLSLVHHKADQDLKAIVVYLVAVLAKIYSDAMARKRNLNDAANAMSVQVKKVLEKRAELLVDSYLVSAQAEGQLSGAEVLGVTKVEPEVEYVLQFVTKRDLKVCPRCKKLEGKVFTLRKARGVLPLHPRCRCRWKLIRRQP